MTADTALWRDEHTLDHRRRLRTAMFVSVAIHAVMAAIFAAQPPTTFAPEPAYLAVELVAAAPPSRAPARAPAPTPPAAEPAPAEPAPPPAPAPTVTQAPVQVLPEETPGRIREAKPAPVEPPKEVAKSEPKPAPTKAPRRRRREKAVSYEDAMAALNDELGVDETAELLAPAASQEDASEEATSATRAQKGITVSPEQLAWDQKVKQQIARRFVDLARYRGRGLVVQLEIEVSATGTIGGEPVLKRTSGDLDFDRRAISAVILAAPLPEPPAPGPRRLTLTSE